MDGWMDESHSFRLVDLHYYPLKTSLIFNSLFIFFKFFFHRRSCRQAPIQTGETETSGHIEKERKFWTRHTLIPEIKRKEMRKDLPYSLGSRSLTHSLTRARTHSMLNHRACLRKI